jgi:hypothetical protein
MLPPLRSRADRKRRTKEGSPLLDADRGDGNFLRYPRASIEAARMQAGFCSDAMSHAIRCSCVGVGAPMSAAAAQDPLSRLP